MKLKLTYLLPFAFLLTGCPGISDPEQNPVPKPDPQPLSTCQLTATKESGSLFDFRYKYNSNQQLIQIAAADSSGLNIHLNYDTKGRLIKEQEQSVIWDNEYNEKDQLIKQTRTFNFAPGRAEVFYYIHQYSATGKLAESTYYSVNSPNNPLDNYKYQYEGEVITKVEKIVYAGNGPFEYVIMYTYDGQKPAFPVLPMINFYQHLGDDHPAIGMSAGNVTSCTVIDKATGAKTRESYTISYTYTPEGYPKEATITNAYRTYKRTFNYNCE